MNLRPSPVFWKVLKGIYSDYTTWVRVCCEAKEAGWTFSQITWMLNIFHPLSIIILAMVIATIWGLIVTILGS